MDLLDYCKSIGEVSGKEIFKDRGEDMINIKDANGKWVCIEDEEFFKEAVGNIALVFGMSLDVIAEFREQYLLKNGTEPMTVESVRKVFQQQGGRI